MRVRGQRGSALLMALWIIAVLAVMVLSFSFEAHQQTGINIYVRERNRVNRLVEPGRILGETVLLGFSEAKAWSEDDDEKELDEEDRWYREKRALKFDTRCTIGPILMDADDPESGTVTVDIELANSGAENGINVNELYSGGDKNYLLRWQMILRNAGIDEELEVEVKEADGRSGKRHNLMNHLIACWNDWRDEDDNVSPGPDDKLDPQEDDGAESKWYEEYDETIEKEANGRDEREAAKEDRRRPRNGSIPDIKELGYIRGFRDFPAVLTGGLLHPDEDESEENPRLKGIVDLLGTTGSSKITITPSTTVDQLMTIPGIFPEGDDVEDREESMLLAQSILDALKVKPEDYDVDETRDWWPYKDWADLKKRVGDVGDTDVELGDEANEYIEWQPGDTSVFKMKITCESMGMKREVSCKCYVKDKKVRYIEWRED
ncbi:MAG: hypothetical protein IJG13_16245 [Kiritimatiellae bacterium]|nr:hypothetical protein [Kiritimatiellia bacterium]MBQ6328592.1 hypothetical protein [Kiritimatiellia bacterium]